MKLRMGTKVENHRRGNPHKKYQKTIANVGTTETGRVLAIGGDVSMVQVGDDVIVDWRKSTIVKYRTENSV